MLFVSHNMMAVQSLCQRAIWLDEGQIVQDDLPLIERTLGLSPRVAVMKGLSNYVCRRRLYERSLQLLPAARDHGLPVVADWASRSASGDIAGLVSGYRKLFAVPWARFILIAVFIEGGVFFGGFTYVAAGLHARFGISFSIVGLWRGATPPRTDPSRGPCA